MTRPDQLARPMPFPLLGCFTLTVAAVARPQSTVHLFETTQSYDTIMTARQASFYWLIVLTTLDSGRVLLLAENLSCALTMSSYFGSVVIESFGTMCTIL
jgi:hypothetical protein